MKKLLIIGMVTVLLLSITAGTSFAKASSNSWGYKLNINLQKDVEPYLKVITDVLVTHYNDMNSTYQINSYNVELNGNVKLAGAMEKNGKIVDFNTADSTNANLKFYFNGTFPNYVNSSGLIGHFEPKNLNISCVDNLIKTKISNGTAITDGHGDVSAIDSQTSEHINLHVNGKNIPVAMELYALLHGNYNISYANNFAQHIPLQYYNIINKYLNITTYDNFNFTVEVKYYDHTLTTFSPALTLLPKHEYNSTMNIQSNYSGVIKIVGLQEKYIKILETLLNKTFVVNSNVAEYTFQGNISRSKNITVPSLHIIGEMKYGNENVYVVQVFSNGNQLKSSSNPFENVQFYYFYSPSKNFIVGEGLNIGTIRFDTQPTTYADAMNEIKSIENQENSESTSPNNSSNSTTASWLLPLSIGIVIVVIVGAVVAVTIKRKNKKEEDKENDEE